jgi:hypothetical protein
VQDHTASHGFPLVTCLLPFVHVYNIGSRYLIFGLLLSYESLQCWREILVIKEKRVESGEAKRQMKSNTNISTSEKIYGEQDGDASLIRSVCVQHSMYLYQMTASMDSKLREKTRSS